MEDHASIGDLNSGVIVHLNTLDHYAQPMVSTKFNVKDDNRCLWLDECVSSHCYS